MSSPRSLENLRQRNIGWRIDYILVSRGIDCDFDLKEEELKTVSFS